jgi:hypothetical protein
VKKNPFTMIRNGKNIACCINWHIAITLREGKTYNSSIVKAIQNILDTT